MSWFRRPAPASALFHLSEQLICRPPPWPDARSIHNRAPSEFAWLPPKEAIAAPQVCYRHCYASFPFPGVTKGDTFTDAGQSLVRDRCRHSVKTTSKQSPITNACTTRLTPQSHDPGCWNAFSCPVVRHRRMRIVINVTKNGSSRGEPALISDISVGFTVKFEPSYLGCYSKTNFSDTLYGNNSRGITESAIFRSFSFPSNNIKEQEDVFEST